MSDEFENAPGASEGGNQGQDEGQQRTQPDSQPINLDNLQEFRDWKSVMDRKVADLQRQLNEERRRADTNQAKAERIQSAINNLDPNAGEMLAQEAQFAEMQSELQALKSERDEIQQQQQYQQQRQQWRQEQIARARRMGLTPDDRLDEAITKALNTQSSAPVDDLLVEMRIEMERNQRQAPPAQQEATPPMAAHSALPPGGGVKPTVQQAISDFRRAKAQLPAGDVPGLYRLRQHYAQQGVPREELYR